MRIRISVQNQKLVHKARKKGNLTAHGEVNRALAEHYNPSGVDSRALLKTFLEETIGAKNTRRVMTRE